MRVGVLEWDISILGGRQRTMLTFASHLARAGHEVHFWGNFLHPRPDFGYTRETWTTWHDLDFRGVEFHLGEVKRPRQYAANGGPPREWLDYDVMLFPYGNFGLLAKWLPGVRVICWHIHPEQIHYQDIHATWTNSKSVRARLLTTGNFVEPAKLHVVIPPHDYEPFRLFSKPWGSRHYDICTVGQLIRTKGLVEFQRFAVLNNLRAVIITTGNIRPAENREVHDLLEAVNARAKNPVKIELHATRSRVAEIMGDSKAFVSFTAVESCSLAVYEAMNAGCFVAVQNTSWSAAEQMGPTGLIFTGEAAPELMPALRELDGSHVGPTVRQGMMFDRKSVALAVERRIAQ